MIQEVVTLEMPVDEKIVIQKNRLEPEQCNGKEKKVSLVTGIHGDELDGQYVYYEVIRRVKEHPERLKGIIDIYPCVNPLGVDTGTRGIPMFDLDMNSVFPGDKHGAMAEYVAAGLVNDIIGSDICIDLHSSNVFVKEAPQVRINENAADKLLPYAKMLNADFIWIYSSITVLDATLAYSLNSMSVPTLVVEMGVGLRITNRYCRQLIDGVFNLLIEMGIWDEEKPKIKESIVSTEGEVEFFHAEESGIFISQIDDLGMVKKGQRIGEVIEPIEGKVLQTINSPYDGIIFTIRENPVVYKGALLARVHSGKPDKPVQSVKM